MNGPSNGLAALAAVVMTLAPVTITAAVAVAAVPDAVSLTVPTATVHCETSPGTFFDAHLVDTAGIRGGVPPMDADIGYTSFLSVEGYASYGTLSSGTAQDGTWTFGPFCIFRPSGTWTVTTLHLVGLDGGMRDVSVAAKGFAATFTTVGRYGGFSDIVPASNIDTTVAYGGTKTITGKAYWYYQGRHPNAGVTLQIWEKVP